MKNSILSISAYLLIFQLSAQATITTSDFEILNNTSWVGTLTYLDYQSGKPTDVATTMQIKISGNIIEQNIQYTWEPNKNINAKIKIKKNGTHLGKQKVISKTIKEEGTMELRTSFKGKDNNKKATMFYTYVVSANTYQVTKEVQLDGSNKRFMRNNYNYTKIK